MGKPAPRRWLLLALPLLFMGQVAVGGSSASAAGAPSFANWAQSRFDLANSGFNPNESSIDSTNAARLQQAWVRTDDESSNAAPAVVDNVIYIGCGAAMCAVEAPNQVLKWKARIPSGTIAYSAAAVAGGLVYAGTNTSGAVYAFDVKTGAIRWSFQTAGHNIRIEQLGVSESKIVEEPPRPAFIHARDEALVQRNPRSGDSPASVCG